jgi:hypothetical protein
VKRLLVVGAAALCLGATYAVKSSTDEFTGNTYHLMTGNRLGCSKAYEAQVDFNVQKFVPKEGEPSFQVFIKYQWSTWMFIEDDEPALLLIDGVSERIDPAGDGRHDSAGRGVLETQMYRIEPELLIRLSQAKEIKIRVPGSKWNMDRCFDADNFQRLKDFVAQHAPAPPAPIPPSDTAAVDPPAQD